MIRWIVNHLIEILWLAWAAHWLVSSYGASAPKRVQDPRQRMIYRLKMVLAGALLAINGRGLGWLGLEVFPRSWTSYWVAVGLVAAGLGFASWARLHLGSNWSGNVTLKSDHQLIRSGPYAIVRHPIYTGLLLAFIGSALAGDRWAGLAGVALYLYATIPKLRLEERWLTEEFGESYLRYRREVKALVPFVA